MRIIRAVIALIILLILVVLFIVGCLLYFVDPNKIKPIIISEIEKRSGYHVTMDSRLTWSFYPTISIVAPQIGITGPQEQRPFLILKNVRIATRLASLWEEKQKLLGDFTAQQVQLGGMHIENLKAKLSWRRSNLYLSNIDATFYSGRLQANANITNLNNQPNWIWDAVFTKVELQPLLNDLSAGQAKIQIAGKADARFQGRALGKSKPVILQSMQAGLQLSIKDGILYGIDLNYLLQNAQALLHKTPVISLNTDQTPFESMASNATISAGILRTNHLVINSTHFQAVAKGDYSLLPQTLDLNISVLPKDENTGLEIPIIVRGHLNDPTVALDMDQVSKLLAKMQLDKVKDKVKDEIDKRVPGEVGSLLKGLIGR